MHRSAFTAEKTALTTHEFSEHTEHRGAACERVMVTSVRTECVVVPFHRQTESRCHRLLSNRKMTGSLHQVLQEKVVRPLLAVPQLNQQTEQGQSRRDGNRLHPV